MKENWERALKFTLEHEGIHSNDQFDPGGDTKYGISRRFHPHITDEAWNNFTIADASAIYKTEYWDACHCDGLVYPLDVAVFDTSVNLGTGRAIELRGKCSGFLSYIELRKQYYMKKVTENPKKAKFIKGWLNRCNDLVKQFGGA